MSNYGPYSDRHLSQNDGQASLRVSGGNMYVQSLNDSSNFAVIAMARALLAIQRYFGTRSDTRVGCVRLLHFS